MVVYLLRLPDLKCLSNLWKSDYIFPSSNILHVAIVHSIAIRLLMCRPGSLLSVCLGMHKLSYCTCAIIINRSSTKNLQRPWPLLCGLSSFLMKEASVTVKVRQVV